MNEKLLAQRAMYAEAEVKRLASQISSMQDTMSMQGLFFGVLKAAIGGVANLDKTPEEKAKLAIEIAEATMAEIESKASQVQTPEVSQ